ncbi:MAG: hypothetical protein KAS36_11735 [Anaerolineales bacterium]|nr:hypothetical protein [Anaerolineales bacterium]
MMEKMLQSMMKRYPLFIAMGLMIVIIAVILGAVNASNAANYYAVDKITRDASVELAQVRAGIESTIIWLPYFKFLGVTMIIAGIVMALGVIAMRLENLGKKVMASVPENIRQPIPPRPKSVMLMRMFMMLGMLIIIGGFIVSLGAASTARTVFSNPVTTIDTAAAGSALLAGLAQVHATEAWLEAFKFLAIAFLFMSIVYGLHTIVLALRYQWAAIPKVVENYPVEDAHQVLAQASAPAAAD